MRKVVSFVKQHRYAVVDTAVLLVVVAVCVPLLVLVADARAYCATLIAWAVVYTFHLWRWLPSETTHVRRSAHLRADRVMQGRGVGRVHKQARSSLTTATTNTNTWSCTTVPHRENGEGNRLPLGEVEDSFEWALHQPVQRKFLRDGSDGRSGSLLPDSPPPARPRALTGRDAGERAGSGALVRTAAAPLLRFTSSAAESSSQFLALSTSASPLRTSVPSAQEPDSAVRRSHEPFTHLSRQSSLSTNLSSTPSPSWRAVAGDDEGDEGVATSPVLFASPSPASSRWTHGYVPLSNEGSMRTSTIFEGEDEEEAQLQPSARSSSAQTPSRISVVSSTVPRQRTLTLVPRDRHPVE